MEVLLFALFFIVSLIFFIAGKDDFGRKENNLVIQENKNDDKIEIEEKVQEEIKLDKKEEVQKDIESESKEDVKKDIESESKDDVKKDIESESN